MMKMAEVLFYAGIVLMGIAAASAIVAVVVFILSKKRLNTKLEAEFGERRR